MRNTAVITDSTVKSHLSLSDDDDDGDGDEGVEQQLSLIKSVC